jgi:DNA polymerase III epsilon subunit-like protein
MNYVLVDLETGGLEAANHAIMSVGMQRLDDSLDCIEERYWLVNDPLKIVTEKAVAVNKLVIDPATATPVEKVLEELGWYFQDAVLVAHNAPFDIGWLNNRGGFGVLTAIDTMFLSWKHWPRPQKAKLENLAARLELPSIDAHNSLGDVITMAGCLRELARIYGPGELEPRPIDFAFWAKAYPGTRPQWTPSVEDLMRLSKKAF